MVRQELSRFGNGGQRRYVESWLLHSRGGQDALGRGCTREISLLGETAVLELGIEPGTESAI